MTPFSAVAGATVNIDVSSSSQTVLVAKTPGTIAIRVMNDGSATVWVSFGNTSSLTASTTTDMPVAAGATECFGVSFAIGSVYAAAKAAGSTGKIYFTPGDGI